MISKESVLISPNSVLMASMYATMATTNHSLLNPKSRADFDPEYLIQILKSVLMVDINEKREEYAEEEAQKRANCLAIKFSNGTEQTSRLEHIEKIFSLKNKRLEQLCALQQKFYITLTDFAQMLDHSGEVNILLETNAYINTVRFNFEKVFAGDYVIYNEHLNRKINELKNELRHAIEKQNNKN